LALSEICQDLDIALLSIRQYGLIASLRLYKSEVAVIESKPDNVQIDDLRVVKPFPELENFALSFDMSSLDSQEHGHTPYVVILIQLLKNWRAEVCSINLTSNNWH